MVQITSSTRRVQKSAQIYFLQPIDGASNRACTTNNYMELDSLTCFTRACAAYQRSCLQTGPRPLARALHLELRSRNPSNHAKWVYHRPNPLERRLSGAGAEHGDEILAAKGITEQYTQLRAWRKTSLAADKIESSSVPLVAGRAAAGPRWGGTPHPPSAYLPQCAAQTCTNGQRSCTFAPDTQWPPAGQTS